MPQAFLIRGVASPMSTRAFTRSFTSELRRSYAECLSLPPATRITGLVEAQERLLEGVDVRGLRVVVVAHAVLADGNELDAMLDALETADRLEERCRLDAEAAADNERRQGVLDIVLAGMGTSFTSQKGMASSSSFR
jgi:hypothetical protein